MSETLRPSEEEISGIRKKYEKNMKPGLMEHLRDKLAGDSPLSESREESGSTRIRMDAEWENSERNNLKKQESLPPEHFGGPSVTKEDAEKKRLRAIKSAREWVDEAAKGNL